MERSVDLLPPGLDGLIALVKILRSDHGCPWDREQTPEQIKTYLLEEAYEVLEALDSGDTDQVCDELGDLLFHIVFLARLFEEAGAFDMMRVIQVTTEKMIRRHPHVFGQTELSTSDEVRRQWHDIKKGETGDKNAAPRSLFSSVPRSLPALMRAYRISERAARLSAESPNPDKIVDELAQKLVAFKASLKGGDSAAATEGFGKLFLIMVNLARMARVHPETALMHTIEKFIAEFDEVPEDQPGEGRPPQPS